MVKSIDDLKQYLNKVGLMPLFEGDIRGFSVEEITEPSSWWSDDEDADPWIWRMKIAEGHQFAYAKLFDKKAGFVSLGLYPKFACYRRDGYDFDTLYECGMASMNEKKIMDVINDADGPVASYELRKKSGIRKGFDTALTSLQMKTYITVCGFTRKVNRQGEPYGWHVSLFQTPEKVFGYDFVRSEYGRENVLGDELTDIMKGVLPGTDEAQIREMLK